MRRTAVIASVVAAAVAGGIAATNGVAQDQEGQTLEFVSKGGSFKYVDVKPKATSEEDFGIGDQFLLSVPLFDGGKRIGTLDAQCTGTKRGKGKPPRGVCAGIYDLPDGKLFISTGITEGTTRGAVTGGTGDYAGARGTFKSVDRKGTNGGDPSDETVRLLP